MISVSLLYEEKIWTKFLFFTILLNLIFIFLNYLFVLNLAEFLIFYLLSILTLYTIYSLLINRELIKFKILLFNLISSITILVVILFA